MKFYLTTPIYYVNDLPHIGHAYTTIAADVLARWYRLNGRDVFFLTGTDEHGAKIVQAAEKAGKTPQEFVDYISSEFRKSWVELGATFDNYIRTTDATHKKTVRELFSKLYNDGKIYKKKYEGLYCVQCEKFLAPEDLNEDKCCPDHKLKPVTHSEENWFFKLAEYQDEMLRILTEAKEFAVFPVERRNEVIGKLKTGLQDISISRAALKWGVPLPFDENQVFYVWVDALTNYISGIGYSDNKEQFNKYWPADLHITAKEILWFHAIIWPAMLLAAGIPLPKKLFSHGFFTINGEKMSKTLGNVIKPKELIDKFGVDASRYLMLSLFPFGTDGDVSWQGLTERYNTDLANNLGNLVSRTLTMMEKYLEGRVPPANASQEFSVEEELAGLSGNFDNLEFHRVAEKLQRAIDKANRYIEDTAPWKLAKEDKSALPGIFYNLLKTIGRVAFHLQPFMPETAQKIWSGIGQPDKIEEAAAKYFTNQSIEFPVPGNSISKPGILFPRIQNK
ncbi:MAG: methionine--tRNA ligase [Elusimicrobiota bacterium]